MHSILCGNISCFNKKNRNNGIIIWTACNGSLKCSHTRLFKKKMETIFRGLPQGEREAGGKIVGKAHSEK